MADLAKFEDTEREIAKAENALLALDKFVAVDFGEDDMYHLEEHENGADNMATKTHIQAHKRHAEEKLRARLAENFIEAAF